jgi:alpha-galactosidase
MATETPSPPPDAGPRTIAPLRLELRDGRMQLRAPAPLQVELAGATVGMVIRRGGERCEWHAESLRADGLEALWTETGLRIELRSAEVDGALVLSLTVENCGDEAVVLEEIAPLSVRGPQGVHLGAGVAHWSVFRNGYQSWSATRAYRLSEVDRDPAWAFLRESHVDVRHPAAGRPGVLRSDLVTAIVDCDSGTALGVGFLDARAFFGAIVVEAPRGRLRRLAAVLDTDAVALPPGARLELPPLWLAAASDGEDLLAAWATAAGGVMQARVDEDSPSGWCSWYYYFNRVREADIVGNLAPLAALRDRVPCDYVMVDDGYQRAIGDWSETNDKFPHGMRWLATQIRDAGFEAGIWLAPFLMRPDARLFRERPEWLLRTLSGRPRRACWNPAWGLRAPAYALDTTHPEVLAWLAELARTAVQQWGYRVLKLDFLYAAALPGVRHDALATRAQALRRGLQAIRDGAGEDAFLLACGCPLGPAVGLVDGMRIGPDVAPFWTNWISRWLLRDRHGVATKNAVRNILTRAFMHRRLWLNDPDCLMVRGGETALTIDEVQSLAAVIGLTDGMFVLSDRMDALAEDRRRLLEQAYALRGGAARVVDLFAAGLPELVYTAYEERIAIGAFNFGERPAERDVAMEMSVAGDQVHELWSGATLPVHDGRVALRPIPPHGCRVVLCDPVAAPLPPE